MTPLRRIAPTVAPPSWRALRRGLRTLVTGRGGGRGLSEAVSRLFPESGIATYSWGRAALAEAFAIARRATGRDRVVLPAYTSYSVAAAATAAGVEVGLCDIDPITLGFGRDALRRTVDHRTAAVVLGNLYGYPERTDDLDWLGKAGVVVIDDAAQALGATEGGRAVGARGDLGILSFGRGKCVSTGAGGALLIHRTALREYTDASGRAARAAGTGAWLTAASLRACTSPLLFGLLSRLPGARVGESWYDPAFLIEPAPRAADGLASDLGAAVQRNLEIRRRVAGWWLETLSPLGRFGLIAPPEGVEPAYLRVPVFASDARWRDELARRLAGVGFAFVRSFPSPLAAIPEFRRRCVQLRPFPGAQQIADRVMALPCHAGVRRRDIARARQILMTAPVPEGTHAVPGVADATTLSGVD